MPIRDLPHLPRALSVAAVLLVAVAASACVSNRTDVFAPLGRNTAGTKPLHMLVATTREKSTDAGEFFSGERGNILSLTEISLSIPPESARQIGEVQWPRNVPGDPQTEFVVTGTELFNPVTVRERLRKRLKEQGHGRVLLFIHGYNNRFADAVFRFAQIAHDSGAPSVPVLFTWPSRAKALAYGYDRESATYSRDALELAIRALVAEPSVREIDVLAHSMGNWVALESLRQIAIRDGRLPAKVKNVMLAAPDVDVDVFGMQIARMGEPRPRFTLFASQDDKALAFSRRIQGGIDRLGQVDASKEPLRSQLVAQRVEVLDLTALKGGDSYNHGKFAESPPVVQFIGRRLAAGQTLDDHSTSLSDQIVSITTQVGAAASTVVTSPLSILEEQRSRSFGAQLNNALRSAEAGDLAVVEREVRAQEAARSQQMRLLQGGTR
jgi:esterase/lipase superfamily enzyme